MNKFCEETIRKKINALKNAGVSASELARRSGVPQPCISRFLAGKTITLPTLEKLWPFLYGGDQQYEEEFSEVQRDKQTLGQRLAPDE